MTTIGEKADYVRGQTQTRDHECHWPGCAAQVPPAMWGCKKHWYALPQALRQAIWRCYRPGQEIDGQPSTAYLRVAGEVRKWIRDHAKPEPTPKPVTRDLFDEQ
jgi:hypothetical protein